MAGQQDVVSYKLAALESNQWGPSVMVDAG
jgi:hypothetical protein